MKYNYKIIKTDKKCKGCSFSLYNGCFCPDDFPTKECAEGEIIVLAKGSKIIDPIVNGKKMTIRKEF